MPDLECPYCEHGFDIDNHDDGYGCREDVREEAECPSCEKRFTFTASISFHYRESKADCLNGAAHRMESVVAYPPCWPDWVRCKDCDHEIRGKYVEPQEGPCRIDPTT